MGTFTKYEMYGDLKKSILSSDKCTQTIWIRQLLAPTTFMSMLSCTKRLIFGIKLWFFFKPIMTNLIKTICLTLQADFGNPNTHPHNKNKTKTVFYASPEDFTFF